MSKFAPIKEEPEKPGSKEPQNLLQGVTQAEIDAAETRLYGAPRREQSLATKSQFDPLPAEQTAQPDKREGSIVEHVKSGLAQYPAGLMGLADLVGMVSPTHMAARALGAKNTTEDLQKKVTKAAKTALGVEDVRKPETFGEKAAEFMGGAIPDILSGGATTIPKLMAKGVTKEVAAQLVKQAAKEMTYRTAISGAGAVGAAGAEMLTDSPTAAIVGSLLGAGTAAVAAPRIALLKDTVKSIRAGDTAEKTKGILKPYVEKNLQKQMATEMAADASTIPTMQKAAALETEIPGLKFGAAGLTKGAAKTATELASRDVKAHADLLAAQNRSGEAILNYISQPATRMESQLDSALKAAKSRQEKQFLAEEAAVAAQRAAVVGKAGKTSIAQPDVLGAEARKVGEDLQAKMRPIKNAQYENAKNVALVEGAQYDSAPAVAAIRNLEELPAFKHDFANMPQVVGALKGMLKQEKQAASGLLDAQGMPILPDKTPPTISYEQLDTALRTAKSDAYNLKHSLDPNKAIKLKALNETVDTLNGMMFDGRFKQTEIARRAADDWYKAEWAPRFREGLNAQMFMKKATQGVQKVPDSQVFSKYAASPENAKQFNKLFSHDPTTVKRMEDHVTADFVQKVASAQNPETAFIKWKNKNGRNIEILGESNNSLPKKFESLESAFENTGLENLALIKAKPDLNAAEFGKLLRTKDVDQIVTKAYDDRQVARNISRHLDQDGKALFFNNLMDEFHRRVKVPDPGTVAMDATKMKRELEANRVQLTEAAIGALGEKEGKAHMARLAKAADAFEILERTHVPSSPGLGGPESMKDATGVSAATAIALYRAHATGRIGLEHAGAIVGGQAAKHQITEMSHKIYQDMMTDPDLLKKLSPLIEKVKNGEKIPSESWLKQLGKFGFAYAGGKYWAPNLEIIAMPAAQAQQRAETEQEESLKY